jgi:hypothetical protein
MFVSSDKYQDERGSWAEVKDERREGLTRVRVFYYLGTGLIAGTLRENQSVERKSLLLQK